MRRPASATTIAAGAITLLLAGCGTPAHNSAGTGDSGAAATSGPGAGRTISVDTNNGSIDVPRNPQRVVALDSTSFETLQAFGITPVATPKQLLPDNLNAWAENADILDVGTHREPKLEVVAQAQPDLIIGGKRFEKVTPDLQKVAPVLDIAPNTDEKGYVEALKKQTTTLGEVFGKQAEAAKLNTSLDQAVADAAAASSGQKAFLANHSGGKVDNGAGRIGVLLEPLKVTDVFNTSGNSESIHQDSGLAPETVAQANPDLMIVMDRDAAVADPGQTVTPASKTVEAQNAWKNATFMKNGAIVYLADNFYVTEGIQAYTDAYTKIARALESAKATSGR